MRLGLKCILVSGPLAVLCSEIVAQTEQEHICSINYGNKVLAPRLKQFATRIGELSHSKNGELLNRKEIVQKIERSEGVRRMIEDSADTTADGLVQHISATFFQPDERTSLENATMKIMERFMRLNLDSALEEGIEAAKCNGSPMFLALLRVREVAGILKELGVINATDLREIFKEVVASLIIDICDERQLLNLLAGQPSNPVVAMDTPEMSNSKESLNSLVAILTADATNDCSTKDVIKKIIDLERIIKILCQDKEHMSICSVCAYPDCDGSYITFSKEEKERIFQIAKKSRVFNSLLVLILEYLKKHVEPDYTTPEDEMKRICDDACMSMLFLADTRNGHEY